MNEFARYHAIVNAVYFISLLVICVIVIDPVIYGITFLVLSIFMLRGNRQVFFMSSVLMLSALLMNPLFNHRGVTVLFYLGNWSITGESVFFGFCMSLFLGAVFYIFSWSNRVISGDKWIAIFGGISTRLALLFSMSLELVPRLRQDYNAILFSRKSLEDDQKGTQIVSGLIGNALEDSIDRSDSMKARGYYVEGRRTSILQPISRGDIIFLITEVIIIFLCIMEMNYLQVRPEFFPKVTLWEKGVPVSFYITYLILLLLPWLDEGKEALRWKISQGKY